MKVIHLDTPTLGDRSYIAHDGATAVIVDPQRDTDRVQAILDAEGVAPGLIVETHMHNDYVSGGLPFAREYGIPIVTSHEDPVQFERTAVQDSQVVNVGSFAVQAIHTPGHTFTHMSYVLLDGAGRAQGVFTGGSLLHGSTGRPDLLGPDHAPTLAGLQHGTANRLADLLEDGVNVHPTHGFGSFCAATATCADHSTIGDERRTNPAILLDRETFIRQTLEALDAFPAYYKYMGPANHAGPTAADLSPVTRLTPEELRAAMAAGAWVVDLRSRDVWAGGHVPGTVNIGLDGSMATYLGWLYPYETPLVLLGSADAQIAEAQRELVRIGIDRPSASIVGAPADMTEDPVTNRIVTFAQVPDALADGTLVLDVRRNGEYEAAHIDGVVHIPLHELPARVDELPPGVEAWVHCAGAYRAAAALGILEGSGRTATLINEPFEACLSVPGLTIVSGKADSGPVAADEHTLVLES